MGQIIWERKDKTSTPYGIQFLRYMVSILLSTSVSKMMQSLKNEAVIVALKKFRNNCVLFLKSFKNCFSAPELMNLKISNV